MFNCSLREPLASSKTSTENITMTESNWADGAPDYCGGGAQWPFVLVCELLLTARWRTRIYTHFPNCFNLAPSSPQLRLRLRLRQKLRLRLRLKRRLRLRIYTHFPNCFNLAPSSPQLRLRLRLRQKLRLRLRLKRRLRLRIYTHIPNCFNLPPSPPRLKLRGGSETRPQFKI